MDQYNDDDTVSTTGAQSTISEEMPNSGVGEAAEAEQANARVDTGDDKLEEQDIPSGLKSSLIGLYWSNSTVSSNGE